MISYTDGEWIATFDGCGALVDFMTVDRMRSVDWVYGSTKVNVVEGETGRKMIASIRRGRDMEGETE